MKGIFRKRGYSDEQLNTALHKAFDESEKEKKPFQTFPSMCRVRVWILRKSRSLLKDTELFKETTRITFCGGRNLKDKLVHSDCLHTKPTHLLSALPEGHFKCGRCTQRQHTTKCTSFSHPVTGKEYKIRGTISCTTTGVVYLIKCSCGKVHVGMTTRSLKMRMAEHCSAIKTVNKDSPAALHFDRMKHPPTSYWYTGIERVQISRRGGNLKEALLKREAYWITELDALTPVGMSEDLDLRVFLWAFSCEVFNLSTPE